MLGKTIDRLPLGQRVLVIYSGVLTAAVCVAVLCGFVSAPEKAKFKELEVQRINVVEPDGTLRMAIHNNAWRPDPMYHGKVVEHPNPQARHGAGILFFNDEGSEMGGLMFGGYKDADGKIHSGGHLSFDKYDQDQVLQLLAGQEEGREISGIILSDRPDRSIIDSLEEAKRLNTLPPEEKAKAVAAMGPEKFGANRVGIVRGNDGLAVVALSDATGKPRIKISVAADGTSRIQFLDANGKVLDELGPKTGQSGAKR